MRWIVLTALPLGCGGRAPTMVMPTPVAQVPSLDDVLKTCAFEISCLHDPPIAYLHNLLRESAPRK
jgi:hypothetical protein